MSLNEWTREGGGQERRGVKGPRRGSSEPCGKVEGCNLQFTKAAISNWPCTSYLAQYEETCVARRGEETPSLGNGTGNGDLVPISTRRGPHKAFYGGTLSRPSPPPGFCSGWGSSFGGLGAAHWQEGAEWTQVSSGAGKKRGGFNIERRDTTGSCK